MIEASAEFRLAGPKVFDEALVIDQLGTQPGSRPDFFQGRIEAGLEVGLALFEFGSDGFLSFEGGAQLTSTTIWRRRSAFRFRF